MAKSKSKSLTTTNGNGAKGGPVLDRRGADTIEARADAARRDWCDETFIETIKMDDGLADVLLKAICEDGKALYDASDFTLINVARAIGNEQRARLIDDLCHDQGAGLNDGGDTCAGCDGPLLADGTCATHAGKVANGGAEAGAGK
jgi:hypothetical protein